MPEPNPCLCGVPFTPLYHHDGRFIRAAGLFAFARSGFRGRYVVLHLELSAAINRSAGPGHARWSWALCQGMDTLLIHVAGWKACATPGPEVDWHPGAQVVFGETEAADDEAFGAVVNAVAARA